MIFGTVQSKKKGCDMFRPAEEVEMKTGEIRRRVWEIVETARPGDHASHAFDVIILWLIVLNGVAVIAGSVSAVQAAWGGFFNLFEVFSVAVFTMEYVARVWACTADLRFAHPIWGRIRLIFRPMLMVDLLAILPFYLPFIYADLRIFRVLKIARYSQPLVLMGEVIDARKEELMISAGLMGLLLVISSSLLYQCENPVQPDRFSSIPATMWWAVATLTTVGYGDLYPVTPLGKIFAGISAVLGIGMFALPTGILGAGFMEAIQRRKEKSSRCCPHCGKPLDYRMAIQSGRSTGWLCCQWVARAWETELCRAGRW